MAARGKGWLSAMIFALRPGPTGATKQVYMYFLLDLQRLECV